MTEPHTQSRRLPLTLLLGAAIIAGCEFGVFYDVLQTPRGPVHTDAEALDVLANLPTNVIGEFARFIAINMTPFAWVGYLILLEGILAWRSESPIRRRPHHFATLCFASVFIWCVFDAINFYSIQAWRYIGIPAYWSERSVGYFIAFAAIVPGMLLSGQFMLDFGWFNWARFPKWRMPKWAMWLSLLVGLAMLIWPLVHPDPITNLTLWTSLVFLLDPINLLVGRPSMFRDWQNGWYGRTLAGFAGGLMCGFLWEFWNYWALSKWTYHLPFLGSFEHYRYFEMPLPGLIGFIPFGIECWVMWQFMRIPLDGMVEPLTDERQLL